MIPFQKNVSPNGNWMPVVLGKSTDVGRIAKIIGKMTTGILLLALTYYESTIDLFSDSKVVPAFVVIFAIIYWCVAISAYLDTTDNY